MTEENFCQLLQEILDLQVIEGTITADVRPGRSNEKWLNLLLQNLGLPPQLPEPH